MKSNKRNKRALILAVSSILALQQAVVAPSFGIESSIIDAGGNTLTPNGQNGSYNISADAFNQDKGIGFKHFQEFVLGNKDVANFIFKWYNTKYGTDPDLKLSEGTFDKFVTFIDGNAQIHGIVNALNSLNGQLKSDGQLVFVAPGGLVVGSSGVLNVGSLSVLTPTEKAYEALKKDMPTNIQYATSGYTNNAVHLPDKAWDPNSVAIGNGTIQIDGAIIARGDVELNGGKVAVGETGGVLASVGGNNDVFAHNPATDGKWTNNDAVRTQADALFKALVKADNMESGNQFAASNGNIVIKSNVGTSVAEGGLVRTYGPGNITIDNTGIEGVIINGEVANHQGNLTITNAAGKIASTGAIKNKGVMTILNELNGTGIELDGVVENDGTMNITNKTGTEGINIINKVTNKNGNMTITNSAGKVTSQSTANITNTNGDMTILNNGAGTGIDLDGIITNTGNMVITNETGTDGLVIKNRVTNNDGDMTITNSAGKLASQSTANINNTDGDMTILNNGKGTGIDLDGAVTNSGVMKITNETGNEGLIIRGDVTNNKGTATITNKVNKLNVESNANVTSNGTSLLMDNSGDRHMNIMGHVTQTNRGKLDFKGTNSNIVIGDETDNDFYVKSNGETTFTVNNGNLYNYGVAKTLIQTTDGANLTMNVTNGSIGKEVGPCDGGACTGIGIDGRDWTKSVNVNVDGIITATSTGSTNREADNYSLINLASAGNDMKLNYAKSDGRVILLADNIDQKATDDNPTWSILNAANKPNTINIEGTGISVIAGKDIGEKDNKVTFRQNGVTDIFDGDSATKPHVPDYASKNSQGVDMLAIRDINVKGMDGDNGEKMDTNVCAMIARTGDIDAEFSGNTYIREITAQDNINLVTRGKNLYIENLCQVPTYPTDY